MSESDETARHRSLRSRSVKRVLDTATNLIMRGRLRSQESATRQPSSVRDHLLIRLQQEAYREMHQRFTERAGLGEGGLGSAVEALDSMWMNIRQLRAGAPAIMKTLSSPHGDVQAHLAEFYLQSTSMLEDAIRSVFSENLGNLTLPPDRMAVLVRVMLEGLIVELAQARTPEDVAIVDQAYADVRVLFQRFVLAGVDGSPIEPITLEPIPLPW